MKTLLGLFMIIVTIIVLPFVGNDENKNVNAAEIPKTKSETTKSAPALKEIAKPLSKSDTENYKMTKNTVFVEDNYEVMERLENNEVVCYVYKIYGYYGATVSNQCFQKQSIKK